MERGDRRREEKEGSEGEKGKQGRERGRKRGIGRRKSENIVLYMCITLPSTSVRRQPTYILGD